MYPARGVNKLGFGFWFGFVCGPTFDVQLDAFYHPQHLCLLCNALLSHLLCALHHTFLATNQRVMPGAKRWLVREQLALVFRAVHSHEAEKFHKIHRAISVFS
jgi:hypothetical protein